MTKKKCNPCTRFKVLPMSLFGRTSRVSLYDKLTLNRIFTNIYSTCNCCFWNSLNFEWWNFSNDLASSFYKYWLIFILTLFLFLTQYLRIITLQSVIKKRYGSNFDKEIDKMMVFGRHKSLKRFLIYIIKVQKRICLGSCMLYYSYSLWLPFLYGLLYHTIFNHLFESKRFNK